MLRLYARPPFKCFHYVCLGTFCTVLLAIDNSNTELMNVQVERLPEERGFSLEESMFLRQVRAHRHNACLCPVRNVLKRLIEASSKGVTGLGYTMGVRYGIDT
ncbi:hypothetical protein NDU88_007190 [Pleurodeles waltl]|uniref:Abnormal spindle-like microcephaly-associated protein ASH domain-containing protein n=1 Tax=Pleurodeles waltl TaxID=8319 RepID=A0AAV7N5N2_PLEWA|nr:hypothetical protein NDU88_007190 [Pleurodeles waltl]